jgi:hypothetical protein
VAAAVGRIEHANRGKVRGDLHAATRGVLLHHGQYLPVGRGARDGAEGVEGAEVRADDPHDEELPETVHPGGLGELPL